MSSWPQLSSENELNQVLSQTEPYIIFKHSYRCSISSMAKSRLLSQMDEFPIAIYEIDVVANRDVSLLVEDILQVRHESPQVLLMKAKQVLYHRSHMAIRWDEIKEVLAKQIEW